MPIYNYVSSVENPLTWGQFTELNIQNGFDYPFSSAIWYLSFHTHKTAFMNRIYMFFLHLLPAMLIDLLSMCVGQRPRLLKVYKKIHKFSSVISFFCTNEWVSWNTSMFSQRGLISILFLFTPNRNRCLRIQTCNDYGRKSVNAIKNCSISIWKQWIGWNIRIITSRECVYICSKMICRRSNRRGRNGRGMQTKWIESIERIRIYHFVTIFRFYWAHQLLKAILSFIILYVVWTLFSQYIYRCFS